MLIYSLNQEGVEDSIQSFTFQVWRPYVDIITYSWGVVFWATTVHRYSGPKIIIPVSYFVADVAIIGERCGGLYKALHKTYDGLYITIIPDSFVRPT
jgi:hypothetical protein